MICIDMIVPSHGHNVAPVLIEARIKKEVPFLSNVMLVGDGQDYICCLLTLKVCVPYTPYYSIIKSMAIRVHVRWYTLYM